MKNSKVFTNTAEHAYLLNTQTGQLTPVHGGSLFEQAGSFDMQTTLVIKTKAYSVTAVDFKLMKELWNVNSADVEVLSLEEFFTVRTEACLLHCEHPKYFFLRKDQNVLEMYERRDWELLSSLQTEEKIFKIFARNFTSGGFFPVEIKGKLDFVVINLMH